tara:strand:- start:11 stop:316 length:306 start_codon:yes stop_codon:yes gene_type:complete
MKKLLIFIPLMFLIFATTITKKSTKDLDKKIFEIQESIRVLENKHELALLDYNVLTTPKKLMEYQKKYFEDDLVQKNLEDLKWLKINKKLIEIENLNNFDD